MILTTKTEKSGEEIRLTATYGSHVIELDYKRDKDLGMNHSLAAAEMRKRIGLISRDLAGGVVKATPDSWCEIEVSWVFVSSDLLVEAESEFDEDEINGFSRYEISCATFFS